MTPDRLMFPIASPRVAAAPDAGVVRRLDSAERELHVQFTRIAQLQAQLDLVTAALQRLS